MGTYSGIATLKAGGVRVEVMTHAQSGVDPRSGLKWWRGAFSTTDDGGAFALFQIDEATIELANENDTGRVLVTGFNPGAGVAQGRFTGTGDPPRSLT
jgi:hypothetical protein